MAKALAPAYVRISGTWANTTYFAGTDTPPKDPPQGYNGVLTRQQQWQGAIGFSNAVGGLIVTSVPISPGPEATTGFGSPTRPQSGLPSQRRPAARSLLPNIPMSRRLPRWVVRRRAMTPPTLVETSRSSTHSYARTTRHQHARSWVGGRSECPMAQLAASAGDADAFSYYHYGAVSQRCAAMGHQMAADQAFTEDWLGRTDVTLAFYRAVRDQTMPGDPFWLTEVADAACGGNPWGCTFPDTFRYFDQPGRLARQQVLVVMHSTLDASDYSLLDETTFEPKPDHCAALLWRRLMETRVLDTGITNGPGLHLYAQCLRNVPGGVAILALNTDRQKNQTVTLPRSAERYTLTSDSLTGKTVALNGTVLQLREDDASPDIHGQPVSAGPITLKPVSVTFLAIPDAQNRACQR